MPRFLLACLTLLLAASLGPVSLAADGLSAGAAKLDITPEQGVSLSGPISKNPPVARVHDPLHARALVLDDGEMRLAIVVCDLCMVGNDVVDAAKRIVHESSGFPLDRMLIAATHTHAAPRAVHIGTEPVDDRYHKTLSRRIAQAIRQAEANLAPARIGYGSFEKPELLACRRFLCEPGSVAPNPFGETGERIKSVSGSSSAIIEPAGPIDPQFSVVSIQHADGGQIAVLGNFSIHYCGGYEAGTVSADYFGYFAESIEAQLRGDESRPAVVGIMSNGTSGNTGSFQGDTKYARFEGMQVYGRMLANEAVRVVREIDHRSDVDLDMRQTVLTLGVRRPDDERVAWAKEVLANPDAKQPHRWTKVYAGETLHLAEFPAKHPVPLQAIRIGDFAIAAAPCEVFAETGLAIKRNSPHEHTFTIELANGYGGYLPPRRQHELGGYETWPARSSFLEVDAEAQIRERLLSLLDAVMD